MRFSEFYTEAKAPVTSASKKYNTLVRTQPSPDNDSDSNSDGGDGGGE